MLHCSLLFLSQLSDFTGAKIIVDELGENAGVNLQTLISIVPSGQDYSKGASWSGARFGDHRSHPTPSQWHE